MLYKSYKIKILSTTFKYSNFSNSAVFHIFITTEYFEDKVIKKNHQIRSKCFNLWIPLFLWPSYTYTDTNDQVSISAYQKVVTSHSKLAKSPYYVICGFTVLEPGFYCLQAMVYQNANNSKH